MPSHVFVCAFVVIASCWCTLTSAELSSAGGKDVNATCIDVGDCPTVDTDCKEKCGCDRSFPSTYDNKTNDCVINIKLLILSLKEKYDTEDNNMPTEEDVDDMGSRIRAEADKIFKGVIVAAFLFIACASVCTFSACIYCCRINYTWSCGPGEDCGYNMIEASLLDTAVVTLGALLIMTLLTCLCIICMKISDLRMKSYILEMAKRKGIEVDLDRLDPKYVSESPQSNENCTILIPDVVIVL